MYNKKLYNLMLKGIIGVIIGSFYFFIAYSKFGFKTACITGIIFFGLPYGWDISVRITHMEMSIDDIRFWVVTFVIRFYLGLMLGWITYPITLIYYIIKSIYYKNSRL